MNKWKRVAATLFVVGLIITLTTGYDNRRVVVAHETWIPAEGSIEMGPYDPGHYDWAIWIEDYYPGFDGLGRFHAEASDNLSDRSVDDFKPTTYQVREFDGIECEFALGWHASNFPDNDTYFYVYPPGDPYVRTEDTVEIFLVRSGSFIYQSVFIIGLNIMLVGLLFLVALWWSGRRREKE